jgi:hypothetical protein
VDIAGTVDKSQRPKTWAYVEAANFMRRYCPEARNWHQRKTSKTNQIVATKALSNKIARACYFIIKDQTDFDPKMLFNLHSGKGIVNT